MSILGRIISIINVIYFLILTGLFTEAGSKIFMRKTAFHLSFFFPVLLGVIYSILFYRKTKRKNIEPSQVENILAMVPIINVCIILIFVLFVIFFKIK